jgi:hypothetical protein
VAQARHHHGIERHTGILARLDEQDETQGMAGRAQQRIKSLCGAFTLRPAFSLTTPSHHVAFPR